MAVEYKLPSVMYRKFQYLHFLVLFVFPFAAFFHSVRVTACCSVFVLQCAAQYARASNHREASLMYAVSLEMDNSLKWVLFNVINGQIASDAL